MESGAIDLSDLSGGFDLAATLESGQSYLWNPADGATYDVEPAYGADRWYWTTLGASHGAGPWGMADGPAVVRVRQRGDRLEWESHVDPTPQLGHRLRLEDDLVAIRETAPDHPLVQSAYDAYWGMRLVREPPFGTLVSFICSAQMRVARIHEMQHTLRRELGEPIGFDGETYHAFPTPERLAETSESTLRDLGLGYRAPYVQETAELVADGLDPTAAMDMPYEDAREYLTQFVGVGEKVADCVLCFSLGFLEAVPLDTWIRRTIGEYFPDCERDSYAETSAAIRARLGGEYAGYAQTYVFHYLRNGEVSPAIERGHAETVPSTDSDDRTDRPAEQD